MVGHLTEHIAHRYSWLSLRLGLDQLIMQLLLVDVLLAHLTCLPWPEA